MRTRSVVEARRLLPDAHTAEDVAQEAVLRAWRSWAGGTRPRSPVAWILTITRNEAARWHGSRAARTWRATGAPAMPDPVDLESTIIDRLTVERAVSALSIDDRNLLHLRYVKDLTQAQVALVTNTPEGTAKVRLHRLRKRLRSDLEP